MDSGAADTGTTDTGAPAEPCVAVSGSGCAWLSRDEGLTCETEGGGEDSGGGEAVGQVQGGSLLCGSAPIGGSAPLLMALVMVGLRRGAWAPRRWTSWLRALLLLAALAAVALLLTSPAHAQEGPAPSFGVDANHFETLDGGDFPSLLEARLGGPWSAAAAYGVSYASGLVNLQLEGAVDPLLSGAMTRQLGASLRLGELLRVGVVMPRHRFVTWQGVTYDDPGRGDIGLWLAVPVIERPEDGVALAWYVRADFNTGLSEYFLGDPAGNVAGWFALEARTDARVQVAANLGAKLMPQVNLPGVVWGRRLEYGLGTRVALFGPTSAVVELRGSGPLGPAPTDATSYHPVEAMAHLGVQLPRDFAVHLGGGAGLTPGLGSSAWRASVLLDYRKRDHPDRDGDGLVDPRDVCPDDPEDVDGYRDLDGCPDPDNDGDGFLDGDDGCPDHAEVFNDWRDADGCPDRVVTLRVRVSSEDPALLESALLVVGGFQDPDEPPLSVIPGEWVALRMSPGEYPVSVSAEGHHPLEQRVELLREGDELDLVLAPVRFGVVRLRVTDEAGAPIAAFLRQPEGLVPLPAEGVDLEREVGLASFSVRAAGHLPREAEVEVPAGGEVELVVALAASPIVVSRQRVELGAPVPFALDSDALLMDGEALLDQLAALLRSTPEIALLRVEGHADEAGSSRYNLDLSRRRAEAVVAYLVAAGVEPERLEAIGTGEARPEDDDARSRRVEFLVLVWDDGAGAAPVVAPPAPERLTPPPP